LNEGVLRSYRTPKGGAEIGRGDVGGGGVERCRWKEERGKVKGGRWEIAGVGIGGDAQALGSVHFGGGGKGASYK